MRARFVILDAIKLKKTVRWMNFIPSVCLRNRKKSKSNGISNLITLISYSITSKCEVFSNEILNRMCECPKSTPRTMSALLSIFHSMNKISLLRFHTNEPYATEFIQLMCRAAHAVLSIISQQNALKLTAQPMKCTKKGRKKEFAEP